MKLFARKSAPAAPPPPLVTAAPPPPVTPPVAPPVKPPGSPARPTPLKLELPNVFEFEQDETRARSRQKKSADTVEDAPQRLRGTILLVESDDEVCRLLSRLLQHEGFTLVKASCLAEARTLIKEVSVDHLLARRACVPANLQTEIALRDLEAKTTIRIVDDFSELMLGQVVDYGSMSRCYQGLTDLLVSLLEGTNLGARGHSHNVAKYCRLVGQRLGMPLRDLDALTLAAQLHDLGSLEIHHRIGEPSLDQGQLLPPSLRPTLDLLVNISFAYNINDLLSASTDTASHTDAQERVPAQATPWGARILRVVDAYETMRRREPFQQDEEALFTWMRVQPEGLFDSGALETLIHIRTHERAINAMNLFWAAVLFVDPHPEELKLLQLRLENDDYHVLTARSIEEALHQLRRENITLVLTERHLGAGEDGFELLRTLKNDPGLRSIPVVFHAAGETDRIKKALELGAEDWYSKPQNVEIMAMKLSRIIKRLHASPDAVGDGVQGNLRDMGIVEMVQIFSTGGRSVHIVLEDGRNVAEVFLQHGRIISAAKGELTGEAAVLDILSWREGRFRIQPLREAPKVTVTTSTDSLLLQSCLLADNPFHPLAGTAEKSEAV